MSRGEREKKPRRSDRHCVSGGKKNPHFCAVISNFPELGEVSERFNLIKQWSSHVQGQMCRLRHYCRGSAAEVRTGHTRKPSTIPVNDGK